ncbi:MAG TPA: arylsulfotransferase family protein [Actinomycetota bacterium]|nr:arylsulfotransferase family protein [Actinomycetota bacterium]
MTGEVIWRIGGTNSDFAVGPDTTFEFQHDARWLDSGILSLFDNGAGPREVKEKSRGLHLKLDVESMTASLVREFPHPDGSLAGSQGNMQNLPNGTVVVGWGSRRNVTRRERHGAVPRDDVADELLPRVAYAVARPADAATQFRGASIGIVGQGLRELERRHQRHPMGAVGRTLGTIVAGRGSVQAPKLRDRALRPYVGDRLRRARPGLA